MRENNVAVIPEGKATEKGKKLRNMRTREWETHSRKKIEHTLRRAKGEESFWPCSLS